MPWHVESDNAECGASKPFAVVKDDDGSIAGCHATKASADRQVAALYASEGQEPDMDSITESFPVRHDKKNGRFTPAKAGSPADEKVTSISEKRRQDKEESKPRVKRKRNRKGGPPQVKDVDSMFTEIEDAVELGGKPNPGTSRDRRLAENKKPCPPGQHRNDAGDCVSMVMSLAISDEDIAQAAELDGPFIPWEGVLAVEGVETGDGREFAVGSLEWPDPEEVVMPIMWQEASEPKHGRSIVVGRIDTIERLDDGKIWGEGVIRSDSPVTEQIKQGLAGGISVDVDSVRGADVELIFPESEDDEVSQGSDIITLFGPEPEKAIYHRGRLRGATLVALPAFVEAQIRLVGEEDEALVASGVPVNPPMNWFIDPNFDGPTAWHVDDDGRVYGHLALWASCHQTFPNRCITPPRERDYPYFMRSELKTEDEALIGVGPITMRTGHAGGSLGARPAAEHYDNTGSAVVDVAVGEDRFGIWVAGALRPTVTEIQLRELRGAALSGDWRRIGGRLRLVAILAVNVPGFPIPKMSARVDDDGWSALVAAGIVTEDRAEEVRETLAHLGDDGTIRVRRVGVLTTNTA